MRCEKPEQVEKKIWFRNQSQDSEKQIFKHAIDLIAPSNLLMLPRSIHNVLNERETQKRTKGMETKSHHKTESALNECLLFKIEINKSTSINVITKNEATGTEKKS